MEAKKIISIIGVVIGGIVAIFLMLRLIYGGPEDFWMCTENGWVKHGSPRDPKPRTECPSPAGQTESTRDTRTSIANPASKFCLEQNGFIEFRADTQGNARAVCVFSDGRECDEWEFYRTKKCGNISTPSEGGEMENIPTY